MVSPRLSFSGDGVAYLYPDCRTALVGKFGSNGKMIEGKIGEVIGTTISSVGECLPCKELAVIDPQYYISKEVKLFILVYQVIFK